jgi:uncharacterized protein YndB with AHSA1/START domain
MIQSIITPDRDAVVCEIDIAAPPERVFKAIADPEEVRRRTPELAAYEMDTRVGGRWFLEFRPEQPYHGLSVIRHEGVILELEPPRLLAYTWSAQFHSDPNMRTIVRWELTPTKTGTHVKLTHSGLAPDPAACKDYAGGWPGILEALKAAVERA